MVHWYYPSLVVPCGEDFYALRAHQVTTDRGLVTCLGCFAYLMRASEDCERCRGAAGPHTCDPGLLSLP